jgi:hypothetical protein
MGVLAYCAAMKIMLCLCAALLLAPRAGAEPGATRVARWAGDAKGRGLSPQDHG